jgi:restriction endonuclease Mrr
VISRLDCNAVSINFLSTLSKKDFNNDVMSFIKEKFKNNEITDFSQNDNSVITYILNNERQNYTYVGIKKVTIQNDETPNFNDANSINEDYVYKFIGAMTHDNVKRGIILTNGPIDPKVKNVIKELNSKMRIVLIDGLTLTKLIWKRGRDL